MWIEEKQQNSKQEASEGRRVGGRESGVSIWPRVLLWLFFFFEKLFEHQSLNGKAMFAKFMFGSQRKRGKLFQKVFDF